MTKQNAKDYLPLVQALSEGKTIQRNLNGAWTDLYETYDITFCNPVEDYRIKPEPKLRPWKPEEVPVGALISRRSWINGAPSLIIAASNLGIHFLDDSKHNHLSRFSLDEITQSDFTHSTDNGKTWKICGVEE